MLSSSESYRQSNCKSQVIGMSSTFTTRNSLLSILVPYGRVIRRCPDTFEAKSTARERLSSHIYSKCKVATTRCLYGRLSFRMLT